MKTILVTTYSPCIHGSYGLVSKEIFLRIHASGKYKIVHHAWFHIDPVESVPWQVIPTMGRKGPNGQMELLQEDNYGQKSFEQVLQQVKPDIVWALGDFYMLKHVFDLKPKYPTIPFIIHVAVDGEPWNGSMISSFINADHIVGISKYGADVINSLSPKKADYIYHGVNTDIFRAKASSYKGELRGKATGGRIKPDDFIIGWVGKDQFRKQVWKFWELIHYMVHGDYIRCNTCNKVTLKEFDKQLGKPREVGSLRMYKADYDYKTCYHCNSSDITEGVPDDKVYGWSHMSWHAAEGWNPNQLSDIWRVKDHVFMTGGLTPNKGINLNDLIDVYNLFDIFYCMSGGEGFGLPVLEAMSCNVPIVSTNYSAHAEVAGDAGVFVNSTFMCEMNSCFDRALADTADAVGKILDLRKDKKKLEDLGAKGRQRALSMTWDIIGHQWLSYIDKVAEKINHTYGVII